MKTFLFPGVNRAGIEVSKPGGAAAGYVAISASALPTGGRAWEEDAGPNSPCLAPCGVTYTSAQWL